MLVGSPADSGTRSDVALRRSLPAKPLSMNAERVLPMTCDVRTGARAVRMSVGSRPGRRSTERSVSRVGADETKNEAVKAAVEASAICHVRLLSSLLPRVSSPGPGLDLDVDAMFLARRRCSVEEEIE